MHKYPHVLIAAFFRDNWGIAESFAKPFGVDKKVPDAWGRPKASDLNPTGTGKGNPLDQGERFIKLVHPTDPARAREMAENYVALVDELDRQAGIGHVREFKNPRALLAKSICEHADIAVEILNGELNISKLEKAKKEIDQAKVALFQLEGGVDCLLRELQKKVN